ncbi:ABC-F family ATP-binding cassette domain-containing protein [Cognatilysobacter terrigena]|uniref:ABC-F family ATP-binding cassette domain-containing protein n=1 Tax=Cognatilysobacter terrigena TaxID=2488749 RepID=UPI001061D142|nr:ABC-F family ATP-binding cassette domain-containing protein [Lysobacter terrigena]
MSDARIRVAGLSFSWPDGTPVFAGLSFNLRASRTGLVAPNGAGKSTLLALLSGRVTPQSGSIEVRGTLGYLPQQSTVQAGGTVAELMGVDHALRAVDAVLAGSTDPATFEHADGHWDLRDRIAALLAQFDLHDVHPQRSTETLSGGEVAVIALAGRLLRRPDVLLLDEPTNHLDRTRRQALRDVLHAFRGCLVVASHDRDLLDDMEQIAELRTGSVWMVSGGFTTYETAARLERAAAEGREQHLRKELRREQRALQNARERAERRAASAARALPDAGLPRIVAGGRARRAEVSAGKVAGAHSSRIEQARDALHRAQHDARTSTTPSFALPAPRVGPTQHVLTLERARIRTHERMLWEERGVTLTIRGPERLALTGDNGAGKTTLLRVMAGDLAPTSGERRISTRRVAYLSQQLDQLIPTLSVTENFSRAASALSDQERADILARLGFRGDRMQLPAAALSGGERVRATLACVLHADLPPQLLLVDEPTNNLDLTSIRELEQSLLNYEGALVVVSHDSRFLKAIGAERILHLDKQGLGERVED